jgi:hypothetical protein
VTWPRFNVIPRRHFDIYWWFALQCVTAGASHNAHTPERELRKSEASKH